MEIHKPLNIIINGAFGKMGLITSETLETDDKFNILAKLGRQHSLFHELTATPADVIIDLTRADCVYDNCLEYIKHQQRFVIGASGLTTEQISILQQHCQAQQLGGLIVPNFSIGSVLCTEFAKIAAKWFDAVDVIEMHHHLKTDSPSGTALHTANALNTVKKQWLMNSTTRQPGREFYIGEIPIHSVRMPGILALQQTIFGQIGETVNLQHQIIDRKAYMPGLKLACNKVMTLTHLKVGLEHWLLD